MKRIVAIAIWLYARLLRLYPRDLRVQFGEELLAVFAAHVCAAQARGIVAVARVFWAELRDLPGIWLRYGGVRFSLPLPAGDIAILAPFLLYALIQAMNGLTRARPGLMDDVQPWLGFAVIAAWLVLLLLGMARGLPRWSLPLVGFTVGAVSFMLNGGMEVVGVPIPWRIAYPDWVSWFGMLVLPLLVVLSAMLCVCAALPWLRPSFWRWRDDWTQLSLLIYGFMMAALEVLDMHPYETPLTIAGLLILAGGAWLYLRGATARRRFAALAGGITLMLIEATLGNLMLAAPEWQLRFSPWYSLGEALGGWLWLMGALAAPALLAFLPRRATPAAPGVAAPRGISPDQESSTTAGAPRFRIFSHWAPLRMRSKVWH